MQCMWHFRKLAHPLLHHTLANRKWRDLERKKRVVDKRAPTDIVWATWKATRPNFRLPMSDEDAAWALVKLSRSGTSATSSSSSSSSSSTASSSASASIVPSASPSYPDWSYSPFTSAPAYPEPEYEAATMRVEDSVPLKVNRPASLYVNVGFTDEDEEAWPEPEFSESSDHSPTSTMFELSTPTSFSFAPGNEVLFAAPPKNLIEGHSAYQKW
jgi:hypothetical protein